MNVDVDDEIQLEGDFEPLDEMIDSDDWKPIVDKGPPQHLVPRFTPPPDPAQEFDEDEVMEVLERRFDGWGLNEIALSMNWGSRQLARFIDSYGELLSMIEEATHESVERAVVDAARRGNVPAMSLWLKHKAIHRGWADQRHITIDARSQQEIVLSVRQGLEEHTRTVIETGGRDAIAALQAGALDALIMEAEVVETDAER